MDNPQQFFDAFVKRSYEEWLGAPVDLLRASCAVHQANVMAERMWHYYKEADPDKVGHAATALAYRKALAEQCPDFGLIWRADNDFKHVKLEREPKRRPVPGPGALDGTLGSPIAVDGTLGAGVVPGPIVVVLAEGTRKALAPVLANVIQMWERILAT